MKNLHTQKNNVKAVKLLIALTILITSQLQAQSLGSVWGNDRAILKVNRDNSNAWGQLRLQTSNDAAYTFSNFKDRLALSFEEGFNPANGEGTEIFSVTSEGKVGVRSITEPLTAIHTRGKGTFGNFETAYENYTQIGHDGSNALLDFNGEGNLDFRYNSTNLMVLLQNGNLGIGTDEPTEKLEVEGNILASGNMTSNGDITANNAVITGNIEANQVTSNQVEADLVTSNQVEADLVTSNQVEADLVTSNQMEATQINIGQSQLSSFTENENTLLTVTGGVKTDKVVLNIGSFPDYVFKNDYKLMPIEDVANYIAKNKHLPNIPAEKEMIASGMDMQMMSLKLVEKVEELTLYTIQQEEKLETQDQLILALTKRLDDLERKETKQ